MTRLMNPANVPLSFVRAELERAREQTLRFEADRKARVHAELLAVAKQTHQALLDAERRSMEAALPEMKRAVAECLRAQEELRARALAELAAQAGRFARSAVDAQKRAMEEALREVGARLRANHGLPAPRAGLGA